MASPAMPDVFLVLLTVFAFSAAFADLAPDRLSGGLLIDASIVLVTTVIVQGRLVDGHGVPVDEPSSSSRSPSSYRSALAADNPRAVRSFRLPGKTSARKPASSWVFCARAGRRAISN